jgi:cytochrome c biogenesis protein CcmG, thiol:disulfide interchange protein DsbE
MTPPRRSIATMFPAIIFIAIALALWFGLFLNPALIPSVMINKPVPQFELPAIANIGLPGLSSVDLKRGKVTLVNVWASWCIPCRDEQPVLLALARRGDLVLVGINNKDEPANAKAFLDSMGNPFSAIGSDLAGRTTIDFGSYGVPESFLIDGNGIIRYKIIGGITAQNLTVDLPREIFKAAKQLN